MYSEATSSSTRRVRLLARGSAVSESKKSSGARVVTPRGKGGLDGTSLAHLSDTDKKKVSRLVEKLLQLGQEHDEALMVIDSERRKHEEEMSQLAASMEGQLSIIEDQLKFKDELIVTLQTKEAMLTSMLALYQSKLKNLHEILQFSNLSSSQYKAKERDLEDQIEHLKSVTENQQKILESLEHSLLDHERVAKHQKEQAAALLEELEGQVSSESKRSSIVEQRIHSMQLEKQQQDFVMVGYQSEISRLKMQLQSVSRDLERERQSRIVKDTVRSIYNERAGQSLPSEIVSSLEGLNESIVSSNNSEGGKDDYSHYSLMFNTSQEEKAFRRLGEVVDCSPGRKEAKEDTSTRDSRSIPLPLSSKIPFARPQASAVSESTQSLRSAASSISAVDSPVRPSPDPVSHSLEEEISFLLPSHSNDSIAKVNRGIVAESRPSKSADDRGEPLKKSKRAEKKGKPYIPKKEEAERKTVARLNIPEAPQSITLEEQDDALDLIDQEQGKSKQKVRFKKKNKEEESARMSVKGRKSKEIESTTHYDDSLFDLVQQLNS